MVQVAGGRYLYIDQKSNSLVQMEAEHTKTHQGRMFRTCGLFSGVPDGGTADFLIKVGSNQELHTKIGVAAGGNSLIYLREGVTTSDDGTSVAAYNMDRTSSLITDASFFQTPTLTSTGTPLCGEFLTGGGDRFTRVGSRIRDNNEWILAKSTNYDVLVTNNSGATSTIEVLMEYYEVS